MVKLKDVFGIFGFCTQLIYDMIPLVFWCQLRSGIHKDKKLSIISIMCLYINAFIYFIFCVFNPRNEIEVMDFCNLQGFYLGLVYIILYYKHLYYQENKLIFYIIVSGVIISSALVIIIEYLLIEKDKDNFNNIINWIGVIFNIGEYLPIGFDYFYLVKNKISEKYTLLGAFVGIINTILWLIWSIIKTFTNIGNDGENKNESKYHTFVANIIGLLLCISQVLLYYMYKKDKTKEDKESNLLDTKITNSDSHNESTFNEDKYSDKYSKEKDIEKGKSIEDDFI